MGREGTARRESGRVSSALVAGRRFLLVCPRSTSSSLFPALLSPSSLIFGSTFLKNGAEQNRVGRSQKNQSELVRGLRFCRAHFVHWLGVHSSPCFIRQHSTMQQNGRNWEGAIA